MFEKLAFIVGYPDRFLEPFKSRLWHQRDIQYRVVFMIRTENSMFKTLLNISIYIYKVHENALSKIKVCSEKMKTIRLFLRVVRKGITSSRKTDR